MSHRNTNRNGFCDAVQIAPTTLPASIHDVHCYYGLQSCWKRSFHRSALENCRGLAEPEQRPGVVCAPPIESREPPRAQK